MNIVFQAPDVVSQRQVQEEEETGEDIFRSHTM
jgi:hypothetical protein